MSTKFSGIMQKIKERVVSATVNPQHIERRPNMKTKLIAGFTIAMFLAQYAATGAETAVNLRSAANFAALAYDTVTVTGGGVINGNIGISPGSAFVPGTPPVTINGTVYAGVPTSAQAQADLLTAYNDAAGRSTAPVTVAGNIGGQTLTPGLYKSSSSLAISSGELTLDAQGDADGVFIFQVASTLDMTPGRQVILAGGAQAKNIFWQVGSSATFDTTSVIHGTIMAFAAITMNTGSRLYGRALALNAAVTLDTGGGSSITDPSLPPAPQNLVASDGAYTNKVAITWSATSDTTGYKLYRNTVDVLASATNLMDVVTNAADDTNAIVDSVYFYWVRSINAAGYGPASVSDSGYATNNIVVPPFPVWISATKGAYTNLVRITWSIVPNASSYEVYRNTSDSSATAVKLTPDTISSPFDDTTMTIGATYYYWVKAKNGGGSSPFSASDYGYASDVINVPAFPIGVKASKGAFTDRVRVTWTAVASATAYEVYRNTANSSASAVKLAPDAISSPFDDSTVTVDATYYYWVKAKNGGGSSPFSASDYGYATNVINVPAFPIGVKASKGAFTDRVRVTWTAVASATAYEVYRNTANSSASAVKLAPDAIDSPFDDSTAVIGTVYYYWVKAKNGGGSSPFSAYDSGYAAASVNVPTAPIGITASKGAFADRVRVTWTVVASASAYEVYRNTTADSASAVLLPPDAIDSPFDDATAVIDITYYYWVKAKNSAGSSPFSASDSGYATASVKAPTAPSGVSATKDVYTDHVRITWFAVPNAASYDVYRNTVNDSASAVKLEPEADSSPFDDATVGIGVTYFYWVKAKNSAGVSEFSNSDSGYALCVIVLTADYDGDGLADPALYVLSCGNWGIRLSSMDYGLVAFSFGGPDCIAVNGDFDGDGKDDPAVYQTATGNWYIQLSASDYGIASMLGFGGPGHEAVPGDYDGDGKTDPAVYNPISGDWVVAMSSLGYNTMSAQGFGGPGYMPVQQAYHSEFDADNQADAAIYNTINGNWTVLLSARGHITASILGFGGIEYEPVPGDFDGDGKADPAVYQESNGNWYVKMSGSDYNMASLAGFGGINTRVAAADYDGDGKADPILLDITTGTWHVKLSASNYADASLASGYVPSP